MQERVSCSKIILYHGSRVIGTHYCLPTTAQVPEWIPYLSAEVGHGREMIGARLQEGREREYSCRGIREWREATEDLRSYCYTACRYSMLCVRAVLRAYHIYSLPSLKTTHVRNQPIPHRSLADEHMCQLLVARVSRSMSHARLYIS